MNEQRQRLDPRKIEGIRYFQGLECWTEASLGAMGPLWMNRDDDSKWLRNSRDPTSGQPREGTHNWALQICEEEGVWFPRTIEALNKVSVVFVREEAIVLYNRLVCLVPNQVADLVNDDPSLRKLAFHQSGSKKLHTKLFQLGYGVGTVKVLELMRPDRKLENGDVVPCPVEEGLALPNSSKKEGCKYWHKNDLSVLRHDTLMDLFTNQMNKASVGDETSAKKKDDDAEEEVDDNNISDDASDQRTFGVKGVIYGRQNAASKLGKGNQRYPWSGATVFSTGQKIRECLAAGREGEEVLQRVDISMSPTTTTSALCPLYHQMWTLFGQIITIWVAGPCTAIGDWRMRRCHTICISRMSSSHTNGTWRSNAPLDQEPCRRLS